MTFEKLLLVGVIAAVVIGPHRLPAVVARLASVVRGLRRAVDAARLRAATELGVPADSAEWRALDPRQYDPRRIIAEAFAPERGAVAASVPSPIPASPAASDPVVTGPHAVRLPDAEDSTPGSAAAKPQSVPPRRIRVGSSAHPRWIVVPEEARPAEGPSRQGMAPTGTDTGPAAASSATA